MTRRDFLQRTSAAASATLLTACASKPAALPPQSASAPTLPFYDAVPTLAPIRAHTGRLFKITVCTRPFRARGPRIEAERYPTQLVVHNYGHGGSGWSLSWGSSTLAVKEALSLQSEINPTNPSNPEIAVLGCGALGLTSAILLQRAGARVTIYARDYPSGSRSFNATGSWTPDSRIALAAFAEGNFPARWEQMARTAYSTHSTYLGLSSYPVEFTDRYILSDLTPDQDRLKRMKADPIGFAHYEFDRIPDLTPTSIDLPPGTHPFPTKYCRRNSQMMFNITEYARLLTEEFHLNGGTIVTREFHNAGELSTLPQKTLINCTGYGSQALFADRSLIPVRGQIGWLIPQPEVNYGLYFDDMIVLSRRDGIVLQLQEKGDGTGWNDPSETPNRAESERAVANLQSLYARMTPTHV